MLERPETDFLTPFPAALFTYNEINRGTSVKTATSIVSIRFSFNVLERFLLVQITFLMENRCQRYQIRICKSDHKDKDKDNICTFTKKTQCDFFKFRIKVNWVRKKTNKANFHLINKAKWETLKRSKSEFPGSAATSLSHFCPLCSLVENLIKLIPFESDFRFWLPEF